MLKPNAFLYFVPLMLGLIACGTQSGTHTGRQKANRLISSSSPYLLQHAYNPVDWYPWGEEALEVAKEKDQLMVISIGYAACHWCHVMEEESFEDTAVSKVMNEQFVSIKVDREQRPDVDQIYMNAAMLTSGRTGWPLNVIALPNGQPVFAATYLPKEDWLKLLQTFADMYEREPQQLQNMGNQVTQGVVRMDYAELVQDPPPFERSQWQAACEFLLRQVDLTHGGLRGAPKFPLVPVQELLLRYGALSDSPEALSAVELTLDRMWQGGIYDHLRGGFARYSVDSIWHVPHFEKMLYDNAQLVSLYSLAYRQYGKQEYRRVVEACLDFVENELSDSTGGFYSSLDADSEGEEGRYYVWKEKDVTKLLGHRADAFKDYYNVSPFGNWPEEREAALNILHITDPAGEVMSRQGLDSAEFAQMLIQGRAALLEKQAKRERPALDDKVLSGWNGLMIKAYADAYRSFGDPAYLARALKAAHFLQTSMTRPDGGFYRSWRQGEAQVNAFASDYAMVIQAYLALYQASFDARWLERAQELMEYTRENFWDPETKLFFLTSAEDDPLIARPRELSDNVIPAANSVLAQNLFLLGTYLYRQEYLDLAEQMLHNVAPNLAQGGVSTANWAILMSFFVHPFYEVAVVGPEAIAQRQVLDQHWLPNVALLGGVEEGNLELLKGKLLPDRTMIYVCQEKSCRLPTPEVEVAMEQMVW
ncbi:MAG: thioredoxin domain-containing protein [Bacteroidota bacterium]